MKIDHQGSCVCNGELPPLNANLIDTIKNAESTDNFIEEINRARELQTVLGRTELSRWADILNRCDDILEDAVAVCNYQMRVDTCPLVKYNTISVLRFTGLLFECTSSRRIYASTDRILRLTECSDMDVVAEVLRLLQTISKRSKFLTQRLCPQDQATLVQNLTAMAQCWGGKLRHVKMDECVRADMKLPNLFPFTFTDSKGKSIVIERSNVEMPLLAIYNELAAGMDDEDRYSLLARVRMLRGFELQEHRMQCLIIRLLSIATLIYCRCQPDETQISSLLYQGFIEEAVALLRVELDYHHLIDPIQTEALRTLCSIVSLEKTNRISQILDGLSAGSYHGFLAVFTRSVVEDMKLNVLSTPGKPSVALSTALLSFIYHLSSADPGGEAVVACGLTQTLLSVIAHHELPLDYVTFATRCTRIIDLFTTIDVSGFNSCKGMEICINRLVYEINECRKEQPFMIDTAGDVDDETLGSLFVKAPSFGRTCHQQRSGLVKGLLTFIKRAIQDVQFQDSVRHLMEGPLPDALMHIISNSEYYTASLYHHATQLVINFIYQEPAQLTILQDKHVPYVMLQSILRKELPNSRDVISHLGNVFTALCLNERGLNQFKAYAPFDHVFKIVLSIKFIATMKKKRSEMNDAAQGIGGSLDDLLRHQPALKPLMLSSILTVLDRLVDVGTNPPPNTKIVMALSRSASKAASQNFGSGSNTPNVENIHEVPMSPPENEELSDDDEEAELSMDEMSAIQITMDKMGLEMDCPSESNDGTRLLPLGDYLLIFTKIFETIITQVAAADLVEGFVEREGVEKILSLCNLPTLSAELSQSPFSQSVASIVKFVLQHVRSGEKLMKSIMEVFIRTILPLVSSVAPEEGASLMIHLGQEGIISFITSLNNAVPILSTLTKTSLGGQFSTELRNRIWDAWLTETGKKLHNGFRKVSRILAWETALIKMIEPTKAVATTQTDPSEIESVTEGTSQSIPHVTTESNNVTSVAVDPSPPRPPAWELAGITQEENAFWHKHRNIADMVVKANKAVSEFLNLLARSCYVPARRNRRYDYSNTTMSKSAQQMADQIFAGIFNDMKWICPKNASAPMEFGRLFEVLNQMSVVLFDERRQPFHAMLQRFYTSGCHQSFCELVTGKLAPALCGEHNAALEMAFVEWFRLAGRLANKHNMLHSMYRQGHVQALEFDPEKYIKLVHNDFFRTFSVLFAKLSEENVDLKSYQTLCETAISVYKEVARNLTPVDEEPRQLDDPAELRQEVQQLIPEETIRQLMDMGFDREDVMQALMECGTAQEATEWLIGRAGQQNVAHDNPLAALIRQNIFVEVGGRAEVHSENAQENREAGTLSSSTHEQSDDRQAAGADSPVNVEDPIEKPIITPLRELKIDTDVSISRACVELMPLCRRLMELGSDLVFSCADLVTGVVDSLDEQWRKKQLIGQIMIEEIIIMARAVMASPTEQSVRVLATRIHFACLLFEHVADEYVEAIAVQPLVGTLILLLGFVYDNFDVDYMQNCLLSPVVLWLDLYDKSMRAIKRRKLLKSGTTQLKWSYLAEEDRFTGSRNKKWQPYSPSSLVQLNKAFFAGKTSCVVKIPRKEKDFTVDFTTMKQNDGGINVNAVFAELPDGVDIDIGSIMLSERESIWTAAESSRLLVLVVSLLHKSVIHHTAAHSILSFTARLTRDSTCATNFIQQGGIAALLHLKCTTTPLTSVLTSLIIRQCIEDEAMLTQVFEKSIRVATNTVQTTPLAEYLGMADINKPRDWCETLNKLAPLSTRNPPLFVSAVEKTVKMDGNTMIAVTNKTPSSPPSSNDRSQQIVNLLLRECLHGEWPAESSVPLGHTRMVSRGAILSLLAELVKSYPGMASLICDAKEDGQSVIHSLIEQFMDGRDEKDTLSSLKTLVAILAGCNHSPKAQESLVSDVKASIVSVGSSVLNPPAICSKVTELCSLMVMMTDSCPSAASPQGRHMPGAPPNVIMKLFHKKKICNDLVKTITYLHLSQKDAIDTVNHVLKTLDTLMKSMNSPSSSNASATITHGTRSVARAEADISATASVVRIPSPSIRDDELNELIARGEQLLRDNHGRLLEGDMVRRDEDDDDDRNDGDGSSDDDEGGHEEDDHQDEAMDEEAVEDSMSSGEEDVDAQEDDTIDEGHRIDENHDNEREEESAEDGEEEEDEMYDYPDEDDDTLNDLAFDVMNRPAGFALGSIADDWDLFGPPIGINREHSGARREPSAVGIHPLMIRPSQIVDNQPPLNQSNVGITGNYRVLLADGAGVQYALNRQNAIRRLGNATGRVRAVAPASQLFDRLFDLGVHINRDRPLMMSAGRLDGTLIDSPEDRRLRQPASAPSALDRMTEGAAMIDALSLQYIAAIMNTHITHAAKKRVEEEKAREAIEQAAKKTEDKSVSSASGPSGVAETATVVAPPTAELARPAWDETVGATREDQNVDVTVAREDESMDTADGLETRETDVSMDEAPPHSSAATVASSLPEGIEERMVTPLEDSTHEDDGRDNSERSDNSGQTETTTDEPAAERDIAPDAVPETSTNSVCDEFREILGDIEIPEGVDPAFLAALPEDMRTEVIRDHQRQQRAQRASQAPSTTNTTSIGQGPTDASASPANPVPAVEPIDQEFLAALPPELQEEILAQHERAVREAEEAVRRANASVVPTVEPEMDGAAVIASLPPGERQQVLAEMDETELQRLPQDMQDEARRARATHFDPSNVLRYHRLFLSTRSGRHQIIRGTAGPSGHSGPAVGGLAGQTSTANIQAVQLLDKDSIVTLTMLFLMDNRMSVARLQKVIKIVCSHAASCDFVIWCLLALLEKATEASIDEEEIISTCPSWLESITVSGVGHNERALKIGKSASRVAVHSMLSVPLSKNVLDTLAAIAKIYPGHFLPTCLRKSEHVDSVKDGLPLDHFWEMVQCSSTKMLSARDSAVNNDSSRLSLESSPMAKLMQHFGKPVVNSTGSLQDKLLRVLSTIAQTLPNDTIIRLDIPEEGSRPLETQLMTVVDVLTRGSCSSEGLNDGRTLLVESMRAFPPAIANSIYKQLYTVVETVGIELQSQIERLIDELGDPIPVAPGTPPKTDFEFSHGLPSSSTSERDRRIATGRYDGERLIIDGEANSRLMMSASSCRELQLPAVMALTDKSGAQYQLLSALQTLSKIRDTMRQMREERRKKEEQEAEQRKKKEEEDAKLREVDVAVDKIDDNEVQTETPNAEPSSSEAIIPTSLISANSNNTEPVINNSQNSMEVRVNEENENVMLSRRLIGLENLWRVVSLCLLRLGKASDPHAVLALQPAAEAFFLVHAVPKPSSGDHHDDPDTMKMIAFAEKHREVLNQVLRQNSSALATGGPFAILTQFPKLLDFDVKRKYFRKELSKMDTERSFRRNDVQVQVRRSQIFSDSFRELFRLRPNEWKHRFYIIFQGEEGQDAGGLLREWFSVITREIFNPNYALFITAPGDMVTYMINKASYINPEHLDYFKFVGRLIAKAIYDNKLLDCYFTRAFYKHILNLPVRYQDIESEDPAFYKSLEFLLNNPIDDLGLDLTFSLEVEEFGVRSIRDLKPDGRKTDVTDANKEEYVKLVCQMKMTGSIRKQLDAFLTGFYEIIPKQLISMFNEQELELLISGLPDVDIDDLANNTEYKMYTKTSAQIQWFWRALRSFEPEDRAKFLQFVTGTSKVPLQGFASLEGMNGVQKFSIHMDCRGGDRLPAAHTCFNQLDLPQYESYEKLRDRLLVAIRECTEGFGFA